MICIYLDDKLSSKLMEDDQDEMVIFKVAYDMYLLIRQIIFQTYGRWSGWNGWYLSRLMIYIYLDDNFLPNYGRWSGWNGWYLSRLWYVFT